MAIVGEKQMAVDSLDLSFLSDASACTKLGTLDRFESRAADFSLPPDSAAQRGPHLFPSGGEHLPGRREHPGWFGNRTFPAIACGSRRQCC
jgi:hypothetical protein